MKAAAAYECRKAGLRGCPEGPSQAAPPQEGLRAPKSLPCPELARYYPKQIEITMGNRDGTESRRTK